MKHATPNGGNVPGLPARQPERRKRVRWPELQFPRLRWPRFRPRPRRARRRPVGKEARPHALRRHAVTWIETSLAALIAAPLALILLLALMPDLRYRLFTNEPIVNAFNYFVFDDPGPPPPPDKQWLERLKQRSVTFTQLPDRPSKDRGCGYKGVVEVTRVGKVEVVNGAKITWPLAVQLEEWIRTEVQPNAKQLFGQDVVKMRVSSSYDCRFVFRKRVLSQHSYANAVDVTGFWLADGRRIRVVRDWKSKGAFAEFLHRIGNAACGIFPVSLTPDFDYQHRHHFHFDAGRRHYCGFGKRGGKLLMSRLRGNRSRATRPRTGRPKAASPVKGRPAAKSSPKASKTPQRKRRQEAAVGDR